MKRIIRNTIAASLLAATLSSGAFALSITGSVHKYGNSISLIYDGSNQETMIIQDKATGEIKDIAQKSANGRFYYEIDSDFSGEYILKIGGSFEDTPIEISLTAENGEITAITAPGGTSGNYDANSNVWTLKDNETVTIDDGVKFMNGIIDTGESGSIVSGRASVKGRISFNENGEIDASLGRTVEIKAEGENNTNNYAFVTKQKSKNLSSENGKKSYSFSMIINGISGDKTYNNEKLTKSIEFDDIYEGNIRLGIAITGVPSGIDITVE